MRQVIGVDAIAMVHHLDGDAGGLEISGRSPARRGTSAHDPARRPHDDRPPSGCACSALRMRLPKPAHLRGIERDGGQVWLRLEAVVDLRRPRVMGEELVDQVADIREGAFDRRTAAGKGEQLLHSSALAAWPASPCAAPAA